MARVAVVKKEGKPVAASVSNTTVRGPRDGSRMGSRNGTGPRARMGLCPNITAAEQIAACGK